MIAVDGTLALEIDDAPVQVVAEGDRLRVDAERPSTLLRSGSPGALRKLAAAADYLGLTVELTAGGRTLLVAGRGARRGIAGRLLRLDHVAVPLRSLPLLLRSRFGG